jgi:hypothetical protein
MGLQFPNFETPQRPRANWAGRLRERGSWRLLPPRCTFTDMTANQTQSVSAAQPIVQRGQTIWENRTGASAERVLLVLGNQIITEAGNRYHLTKIRTTPPCAVGTSAAPA